MLQAAFIVPHPPLIIPEIGRGDENGISDTIRSYEGIADTIRQLKPDTVVIISPHSIMYRDYIHISPGDSAHGTFASFRAPQVQFDVAYDRELSEKIANLSAEQLIPAGFLGERDPNLDHGFMVPLYFIRDLIKDTKFVRIGISGLSPQEHFEFGKQIVRASDELGRRIVLIASGDLSHVLREDGPYGYQPEGPQFDRELISIIQKDELAGLLDFSDEFCTKAAECGLRGFIMMAGALDGLKYQSKVLSYEGPFGVGYGCAEFIVDPGQLQ